MTHHTAEHQTVLRNVGEEMRGCIDDCNTCHDVCLATVTHCLEMGGEHAEASHIRLLLDCAQICETSGDFMLRGSELHGETCAACAAVCERCAEDCERFGDDEIMRACADACRRCADSCREMAA
ncbi:MAG: four-helix bundle copper-binding protein [Actinobacteria bacterium]|nr:four-helix bundle copper-binding protein [Actinomycetota bacterium]